MSHRQGLNSEDQQTGFDFIIAAKLMYASNMMTKFAAATDHISIAVNARHNRYFVCCKTN
jgi:hypothetical protein